MDVLKAQEKHCKDILEEARGRLQGKGSDPVILEKLITQALFQVSKIVFESSEIKRSHYPPLHDYHRLTNWTYSRQLEFLVLPELGIFP